MGVDAQFSANDRALIAEAVRRVERARAAAADKPAIVTAVSAALLQGRRDLFGLVKAGHRADWRSGQNGASTSPMAT